MADDPQITFQYHDQLNPKVFGSEDRIIPRVRLKLLQNAEAFIEWLEMPELRIEDILLTGSNAGYAYNQFSDLDVHIVVSSGTPCAEELERTLMAKMTLWNLQHDSTIHGAEVEIYVHHLDRALQAAGQYSLMNDEWISKPEREPPKVESLAVASKARVWTQAIDTLVDSGAPIDQIAALKGKIQDLRRAGLSSGGEFSTENLAFKEIRNSGKLAKLRQSVVRSKDRELSL